MFESPAFPQNFVNFFLFHAVFSHLVGYIYKIMYNFAIKRTNMKKNYLLVMSAAMMLAIGLSSCSSDEENFIGTKKTEVTRIVSSGKTNVLNIKSDTGDIEICEIYPAYCGRISWPVINCDRSDSTYHLYPLVFTAIIRNSSLFNVMQISCENHSLINIKDLQVGDTLDSSVLRFRAWRDSYLDSKKVEPNAIDGGINWQNSPWIAGGQVLVVGQKKTDDGKSYVTLDFQDLILDGWSSWCLECNYTFNGVIDFEISGDGIYPTGIGTDDLRSMLRPSYDLLMFMMDALHGNESQGQRTFSYDASAEQECLIINSEEEFREAYKGNKQLPKTGINFDYCTLVIGRTYGEHCAVSIDDYELTDNGDTYQLNVTLNNNVNPDYAYTAEFNDLYFWKIYHKMEKKPVVLNRIVQDVNFDLLSNTYSYIRNHYILEGYSGADGVWHRAGEGWNGNERFSIEFKADGTAEGCINNTNYFSFNYTLPYSAKREGYNDGSDHGIINVWNWQVTDVDDDDPVSKQFMRLPYVTQFVLIKDYTVTLYISDKELFDFRNNYPSELYPIE